MPFRIQVKKALVRRKSYWNLLQVQFGKMALGYLATAGPQAPMMGEEFPGQEFGGLGPRTPAAFGGIMDTYTGRRKYGS